MIQEVNTETGMSTYLFENLTEKSSFSDVRHLFEEILANTDQRMTVLRGIEEAHLGPAHDDVVIGPAGVRLAASLYMLVCPQDVLREKWSQLSRVELRNTIKAVARQESNGFRLCWQAIEFYSSTLTSTLRRRDSLETHRVFPEEFWPKHSFIKAVDKLPLKVSLLRQILSRHPGHVGPLSALIGTLPSTYMFSEKLRLDLLKLIATGLQQEQPDGWNVLFIGQAFCKLNEPKDALNFLLSSYTLVMPDIVRFEVMILLAEISANVFGRLPQLRFLVTALRIMPDHVSASAIMAKISRITDSLPDVRQTHDPAVFGLGDAEILELDRQIDMSLTLQRWLVFPEYLTEAERVVCYEPPLNWAADRSECLSESTVQSRDLPPAKDTVLGSDPWSLLTKAGMRSHIRRSVVSIKCRNVYLRTSATHTVAFRSDGRLLIEASSGQSSFFRLEYLKRAQATHYQGEYTSLCVPFGHSNYSHFLLDRLPRLAHIPNWHSDRDFIVDAEAMFWTRQIFMHVGSRARLHPIDRDRLYHLDVVTLYGKAQHPAQRGHPFYTGFFRSFVSDWSLRKRERRIIVHRDRGRRGIDNQEEFYAFMLERGFEVMKLEELSITAQLALFSEARVVVGVHGAGLSNLVTCAPETTVIEILPLNYHTHSFSIIAQSLGLNYFPYLEASESNASLANGSQYSDTRITIAWWKEFLDKSTTTSA